MTRHPKSRSRGRPGAPAEMVLRLLHIRNWNYGVLEREVRAKYQLARWADDWVVTCWTRAEAQNVLARAEKILEELGVKLNREETRIVHIAQGFEFLGFKIQRGKGQFKLTHDRIKSKLNRQNLYAIPHKEVGGPIQRSDQGLDQKAYTADSGRIDQCDQPDHPRMGKLLLSLPSGHASDSLTGG